MVSSSGGIMTVVMLLVVRTEGDFTAMTAGLIAAIQRRYFSGCVVLLTSSEVENLTEQEILMQMQLRKLLSEERIQVTASWIQSFNSTTQYCSGHIPLNVILSSDSQSRTTLEEYSTTNNLAGATWLLFLDTGSMSSFFADIYVPFNCEFLVTWHGLTSMHIYEVYKVAKEKPLNEHYYGRFNFISGLVSNEYNIFRRRSNLEGIVLKVITADDPPIMNIDPSGKRVSGFLGRVWDILEKKMNFRASYILLREL
ncbi:hypothetical protein L9F63_008953, partial [Diploptera punctata]